MTIIGFLKLSDSQTAGTVAIVDSTNGTVIALCHTGADGIFRITPEGELPAAAALYGIPGAVLDVDGARSAATGGTSDVVYESALPDPAEPTRRIYLNAASTCVRAIRREGIDGDAERKVKEHLFGIGIASMSPGFSAAFLAHVLQPRLFCLPHFLETARAARGIACWSVDRARAGSGAPSRAPFVAAGTAAPADSRQNASPAAPNVPVIPTLGTWATDDPQWTGTLQAQTGNYAELYASMQAANAASDGMGAATSSSFAASPSALLDFAGRTMATDAANMVASYGLSLAKRWLFGAQTDPVTEALNQIEALLTTVINDQMTMIDALNQLLQQAAQNDFDILTSQLNAPLATIQSNYATVQAIFANPADTNDIELGLDAMTILDPNTGVTNALGLINDVLTGQAGNSTLAQAAWTYVRTQIAPAGGQPVTFYSNANTFAFAQGLFHLYRNIQTSGVQLVIQAQNYQSAQNQAVMDMQTAFVPSAEARQAFETVMIGGGTGIPSSLEAQRDLIRAAFWPAYAACNGYLGAMPDDMAVCFIPEAQGQLAVQGTPVPVFTNGPGDGSPSTLNVLGYLSGALRNWTGGTNATVVNAPLTGTGTLPPWFAWRLPHVADYQQMLAPAAGLPSYQGDQIQYLSDQGFVDDADQYVPGFAFSALLTADAGYQGDAWQQEVSAPPPGPGEPSNPPQAPWFPNDPVDVNHQPIGIAYMNRGYDNAYFGFIGTFPLGFLTNGGTAPFSATGFDVYKPSDPSSAWQALPWLQVSGGVLVADSFRPGYTPAGSFIDSSVDVKVTLSCVYQGDSGPTTFQADLTGQSGLCFSVDDAGLHPEYGPLPGSVFVPAGSYLKRCSAIEVSFSCNADAGGSLTPTSVDMTGYSLYGITLTNEGGVITGLPGMTTFNAAPGAKLAALLSAGSTYFTCIHPSAAIAMFNCSDGTWQVSNLMTDYTDAVRPWLGSDYIASSIPGFYLDPLGHVRGLFMGSQSDLTATAGAPLAKFGSPIAGYGDAPQTSAVYLDGAGGLHMLQCVDGTCQHVDLTAVTDAPAAWPDSSLVAPSYVAYQTGDCRIGVLHLETSGLLTLSDQPAIPGTALTASGGTVFFANTSGGICMMEVTATNVTDITATAGLGNPPAAPGSPLAAYGGNTVTYIDSLGQVHQLLTTGTSWSHNNLTQLAGAPPAATNGSLACIADPQQIFYTGALGHVHLLAYDPQSGWTHTDVSAATSFGWFPRNPGS